MALELRIKGKVLAGGRVEVVSPELHEGDDVEISIRPRYDTLTREEKLERLRADLQVGIDQLERGEYIEYSCGAEVAADIIARGRKRLKASASDNVA